MTALHSASRRNRGCIRTALTFVLTSIITMTALAGTPIDNRAIANSPGPALDPAHISKDDVRRVVENIRGNVLIVDWHGTWDYDNIQDALDAAEDGDTIIVLPSAGSPDGAYVENVVFPEASITLQSLMPEDPGIVAATVIDGSQAESVMRTWWGSSVPQEIDGFTIRNGKAVDGGGIFAPSAPLLITHCVLHDNEAYDPDGDSGRGGAVYAGALTLEDCTIASNSARQGGGVYGEHYGVIRLVRCDVIDNYSYERGGGVHVYSSSDVVELLNCNLRSNRARLAGGAVSATWAHSDLTIVNCTAIGNLCEGNYGGGVEYFGWGKVWVTNSTILGNVAQHHSAANGGGLFIYAPWYEPEQQHVVANSILRGNSAVLGAQISVNGAESYPCSVAVTNSDVEGGLAGVFSEYVTVDWDESNVDTPPLFVDMDGGDNVLGTDDDDVRLRLDSPCIDAGSNAWLPQDTADLDGDGDVDEPLPVDLLDAPRVLEGVTDMGALEGGILAFDVVGEPVEAEEGLFREGKPGDRGVGAFLVRLVADPGDPVDATVTWHSGDADLTVFMGETLSFDSSNFDEYQPVILAATEDTDWTNGEAVFVVEASGVEPAYVHAHETDNEPVPTVVHVDPTATGTATGATWEDAFVDFQDALAALHNRSGTEEVWIAAGAYVPEPPNGSREGSFSLADGVAYYGGFPVGGGTWEERDPQTYETILSGDLNGDDESAGNGENSYHVVSVIDADQGVVLDGLTVTAGHADGATVEWRADDSWGAGLLVSNGDVSIHNCYFHGNRTWSPVYLHDRDPGGAGVNAVRGSLTITECVFEDNRAEADYRSYGGAVFGPHSGLSIEDCLFVNNFADKGGGAVYTSGGGQLTGCHFIGNEAAEGAVYGNEATITRCTFEQNEGAGLDGGGVLVEDSVFVGNNGSASRAGGTYENCLFVGNTAELGGALRFSYIGGELHNCTFVDNVAGTNGNAVYCTGMPGFPVPVTLTNCVLRDGGNEIFHNPDTVLLEVTYSDVQGGWPGEGNIDVDPMFVAGPLGCYYLSHAATGQPADSPCIDAGSDTAANLGLDTRTTRRDEVGDANVVDMGYHYPITGEPFIRGDFDRDGDVDLDDFGEWAHYITGPCAAEPCWPPAYPDPCGNIADFDDDGDVDLRDFAELQQVFGQ